MNRPTHRIVATAALAVAGLSAAARMADANPYINEIYFDNPGSTDDKEYIEVRGTASASLANTYLLLLENENSSSNGQIEGIFDLTSKSIGSNGFLNIFMKTPSYPAAAAGTTVLTSTGTGFDSANAKYTGQGGKTAIENSGFTALLVNKGTGSTPSLGTNVTSGGQLSLPTGWTKLDSVGIAAEVSELDSKLYGDVNFGPGTLTGSVPTGATYVNVTSTQSTMAEIEWVGRHGSATGATGADWVAANLTDDPASGYSSASWNFGVSGNHAGLNLPEAVRGNGTLPWAYGFDVTDTFGTTNHNPEPASLSLLAGAALLLTRRRRQATH